MSILEGRIIIDPDDDKRVWLDAAPHVMGRVRELFPSSKNVYERGTYTHRPLSLVVNMTTAKDLEWLQQRYTFEVETALQNKLAALSLSYDEMRKAAAAAATDKVFRTTEGSLTMAIPLRDHQVEFVNLGRSVKRTLLADVMGLGKTASGIGVLTYPDARPAIVVAPAHLCTQWEREVKRFVPDATTHVIRGFKNYDLPDVDVIVTSYNRLAPWQDKLASRNFKTVVFDEVHELRHRSTAKRNVARALSETATYCFGLSGTPIYNYGGEIWSVIDAISPEVLGTEDDFKREWCDTWTGKVLEPTMLHSFLRSRNLILRRTPQEVQLHFGSVVKHQYTLDADIEALKQLENVAKTLAMSVLSAEVTLSSEASRQFDWKLRHATGVAKAKAVAAFVDMMVEQGEKVLVGAWHRDVYDILKRELFRHRPVMYTGSESIPQKDAAIKAFVEGDAQVFLLSLRSGAGIDGLQRVASTVVFAELDWSPHVMDQVVARLDRDGQTRQVNAFYLTIPDGSDPVMQRVIGDKRSQHDGVIEGSTGEAKVLEGTAAWAERVRDMAKEYLTSIGEVVPEQVAETGLLGEVAAALRRVRVSTNSEEEMQAGLWSVLPRLLPDATVEREVKISKRSRLDFRVTRGDERVAIECKAHQHDRQSAYRQVRRYVEEAGASSVVLFAPWPGIGSFSIEGTPVVVVDPSVQAL